MTSPIRTRSPATATLARSTGAAMTSSRVCADAAADVAATRAVARKRERLVIISPLPEQRGGGLQHLVGGADHLGVHLISALRRDQVGNLGNDLDIGLLEVALLHVAKTVGVGGAVLRRARGPRLPEQGVADPLHARLVCESRQAPLARPSRSSRCRPSHRDV